MSNSGYLRVARWRAFMVVLAGLAALLFLSNGALAHDP